MPLGVKDRSTWERNRANDLADAISRYALSGYQIPGLWVGEYNDLVNQISERDEQQKHTKTEFNLTKNYKPYRQ